MLGSNDRQFINPRRVAGRMMLGALLPALFHTRCRHKHGAAPEPGVEAVHHRQGESGLGLDAQSREITSYTCQNNATLIAEFREVARGLKANRPVLASAIEACETHSAKLVVASIDRLGRNKLVILDTINRLGQKRIAICDMPCIPSVLPGWIGLCLRSDTLNGSLNEQVSAQKLLLRNVATELNTEPNSDNPFWIRSFF